ncbi:acetyl-CoA carboxylase biotin carboxyl carrier protein subunit [Laceyella sacchari]|jgi:acetyl-CoA carboxylase biotin carboxyl carrier protein|uniref:Acetyl-CoA carboxylase biotin carboxyl carrier protein n=3 Tax=Laceyella TaxID=292635 RepID=A0AA45WLG0_9BACL|nr:MULTISPECIES: biotin/lipoyl-containing protein [Laceyella]AUS09359.1 acetyl-CoA carboxylase biotin carboxyl carrier protein subunit [Laceyella sacchari]MRG26962.1 biotin/lipoyl-binding protein [Laceyella tengchongensis]PRZ16997.1 acetyl-CoA carboxylase biotin carboxyl carrier protein [Laceyella sediminis]UWE02729.1 biotin/lipoyl-binding protein [Laceyella sacchari]SMP11175.1 acetyl-CoA carboxylase biotin carboxyl carrier protein [Laceyella tengchongensis]
MAQVKSTMAGVVLAIHAQLGERIEVGQDVILLESMKMEIPIQAEVAGTVKEIKVQVGDFVEDGAALIELE